jgi:hypothetical protein
VSNWIARSRTSRNRREKPVEHPAPPAHAGGAGERQGRSISGAQRTRASTCTSNSSYGCAPLKP